MIWKEDEMIHNNDKDIIDILKKNVTISLLGFEELLNKINSVKPSSYPPFNIEKLSQHKWCIVLAVAGFLISELDIQLDNMQLIITGNKNITNDKEYIYKGIANRSFTKTFLLANGIEIVKAELENGLLSVYIARPDSNINSIKVPIINLNQKISI